MSSTAPSFGKTSSVKDKRYPYLPLLAPSVLERNPLDTEILSNLRFGSLEIRDT
jgi:hypothetical protein